MHDVLEVACKRAMGPALALCGGEYTHASGHVAAYRLAISADYKDFEVSVGNLLQDGWQPWGFMKCLRQQKGHTWYVQPMVRYR
jgi:hypothetical protein